MPPRMFTPNMELRTTELSPASSTAVPVPAKDQKPSASIVNDWLEASPVADVDRFAPEIPTDGISVLVEAKVACVEPSMITGSVIVGSGVVGTISQRADP